MPAKTSKFSISPRPLRGGARGGVSYRTFSDYNIPYHNALKFEIRFSPVEFRTMTLKTPLSAEDRIADNLFNKQTPFWLRPGFLIGSLVVVYLVVGLFVVTQYGESVDEPARITYADRSLQAYGGRPENLQDEKGPFYGMFALLASKALVHLIPSWKFIDGWHYMSFVAFIISVYFFYHLCRRLVDTAPAIAATLLFGSQPLLWGQASSTQKIFPSWPSSLPVCPLAWKWSITCMPMCSYSARSSL